MSKKGLCGPKCLGRCVRARPQDYGPTGFVLLDCSPPPISKVPDNAHEYKPKHMIPAPRCVHGNINEDNNGKAIWLFCCDYEDWGSG